MYIPLDTIDVWEVPDDLNPSRFFHALPLICAPTDVLVIGTYDAEESIWAWLLANEIKLPGGVRPFRDTFDLNRKEHPRGRYFVLNPGATQIERLAEFCQFEKGGVEVQLFVDHLLLYRPGAPLVPLLDFHDAFKGWLYLSGLYSEKEIKPFVDALGATAKRIINPVLKTQSGELLDFSGK